MSLDLRVLLQHGWGYGPDFWGGLSGERCSRGYFSEARDPCGDFDVVVTHSFGLHFLKRKPLKAALLVAPFLSFPPRMKGVLDLMKVKLRRDPDSVLRDFWANCGEGLTVLEEYGRSCSSEGVDPRKELAKCGLFGEGVIRSRVRDLSCGQKQRLQLAKLIASKANILLLDEPTNHLDLATLEALEKALCDFEGTIIAATHDRWFMDHVATEIWRLESSFRGEKR